MLGRFAYLEVGIGWLGQVVLLRSSSVFSAGNELALPAWWYMYGGEIRRILARESPEKMKK